VNNAVLIRARNVTKLMASKSYTTWTAKWVLPYPSYLVGVRSSSLEPNRGNQMGLCSRDL